MKILLRRLQRQACARLKKIIYHQGSKIMHHLRMVARALNTIFQSSCFAKPKMYLSNVNVVFCLHGADVEKLSPLRHCGTRKRENNQAFWVFSWQKAPEIKFAKFCGIMRYFASRNIYRAPCLKSPSSPTLTLPMLGVYPPATDVLVKQTTLQPFKM